MIMMAKRLCLMRIYLVVCFIWAYASSSYSQRYALKTVYGGRIEITKELDKFVDYKYVSKYKPTVDSLVKPVIGVSLHYMDAKRPESLLSNWVADVIVEKSEKLGVIADFGVCNIGGLRSSMPEGNITIGDIMSIAPFENKLCILVLRGEVLLDLFNEIAKVGGEGVSRAVRMEMNSDGRLSSLRINNKEIIKDKEYTVATIDYLAGGNDGLSSLSKYDKRIDSEILLRDAIISYIRKQTQQGKPIKSELENRIVMLK